MALCAIGTGIRILPMHIELLAIDAISTCGAEQVLGVLDYRLQHSLRNIALVTHDGSSDAS